MSTFKKSKIVMLSTNEPSKIGNLATYQKRSLAKVIKEGINPIGSTVQFWNLYIISDEEIKEGDWVVCLDEIDSTVQNWSVSQAIFKYNNGGNCNSDMKIVATTDTSLLIDTYINQGDTVKGDLIIKRGSDYTTGLKGRINLPQPSQQFIQKYIEEYNKGNIITDVLVEYEYLLDDRAVLPYWNLKVNTKDNTITIKKLKETYNKEELCQILEKYTSFLWSEVGIHYPISLGKDAKDKFINSEL